MVTSHTRIAGPPVACARPLCAPPRRAERSRHRTRARPHLHRHPAWRAHL